MPRLAPVRSAIAAAVACQRRHAVVFGSGLLDDVPLHDLARLFDRVGLVNAVHPSLAWVVTRRYPNFALMTAESRAGFAKPSAGPRTGADLIDAKNLLSQLSIVPIAAQKARVRDAPARLRAELIATRFAARDVLPGRVERVCLITDTLQREEDRRGQITGRFDLLFGIGQMPAAVTRDWEIAPFGEIGWRHRLIR